MLVLRCLDGEMRPGVTLLACWPALFISDLRVKRRRRPRLPVGDSFIDGAETTATPGLTLASAPGVVDVRAEAATISVLVTDCNGGPSGGFR